MHELVTYTDKVSNLSRKVADGEILLPSFQREYVWTKEQIATLLDSVYRGFPIGSILLWETEETLRARAFLDDLQIARRRPTGRKLYLLDGQQRLSTLCGCLMKGERAPNSFWNTVLDLADDRFLHLAELGRRERWQIPTYTLTSPVDFLACVKEIEALERPDARRMIRRAHAAFEAFSNFSIPVLTIKNLSLHAVAPIFERINTTGTDLNIADLMRAALWDPAVDFFEKIERELIEPLSESGFGAIDEDTVLRACAALTRGGFDADQVNRLRDVSKDEISTALDQLIEAAKRTVDLLRGEFCVFDRAMLPYKAQYLFLVTLLAHGRAVQNGRMDAIRVWFWRASFSSHFSGWTSADMRRDHAAIQAFPERPGSILFDFDPLEIGDFSQTNWHMRAAKAKAFKLLLLNRRPIDLLSGQRVSIDKGAALSNKSEFHHLFPRAFVLRNFPRCPENRLANIVALSFDSNRAIKDAPPSIYLRDCLERLGPQAGAALESNLLDEACVRAALVDDYQGFLRARNRVIAREIARLCDLDLEDRAAA